MSSGRRHGVVRRHLSATEALAILGVLGALVGAFLWAWSLVFHSAYSSFFEAGRLLGPPPYEEMVFEGAIAHLAVFTAVAGVLFLVWDFWRGRDASRHPTLARVRDVAKEHWQSLTFLAALFLVVAAIGSLSVASSTGQATARKFATDAEAGVGPRTTIYKANGAQAASVQGFRLGCTDKLCVLYKPGRFSTNATSPKAAGQTMHVSLDGAICVATAQATSPRPKSAPAGYVGEVRRSTTLPATTDAFGAACVDSASSAQPSH